MYEIWLIINTFYELALANLGLVLGTLIIWLVLMVIAVLKVFLIDAAGLAGLARIGSFMALGFALIGIGWFYNRQLRVPAQAH